MLSEFSNMWDGHLRQILTARHRFELMPKITRPVHSVSYWAGASSWQFAATEVDKMLKQNVIEPVMTEWVSPIFFAQGKRVRPAFLWKWNRITVQYSYYLPQMNERIDLLGEATNFSTIDANSGCWKIEIERSARAKTAFTSYHGVFQFTRMLFWVLQFPCHFSESHEWYPFVRQMEVSFCILRWHSRLFDNRRRPYVASAASSNFANG